MTASAAPPALAERLHAILVGLLVQLKDSPDDPAARTLTASALAELQAIASAAAVGDDGALYRVDELAAHLVADHDRRRELAILHGGVVGVRSGLSHLDEVLNGLEGGKLYLLAAMPGAGKTTLALQMAATVAEAGAPALYVSLENDAADLARKTACRLGRVSYTAALKGKLDADTWARAVGHLAMLGGRLYLSAPRATMPDLDALLAGVAERAGQPPALLVLDYLQAFAKRAAARADEADVRERIDRLTPALRALGERYGCAVLAISSQNRAGYLAGGLASLKESGDLEYGADVTMILARPGKDEVGAVIAPPGAVALTLKVDKNRQGLTGQPMALYLFGDRCTVTEAEVEL